MSNGPFTTFEYDPNETGVHWEHFVTAVGIWVYMRPGMPSVSDVAQAFNTTPEFARHAVDAHPWIFASDDDDPSKQLIDVEGE